MSVLCWHKPRQQLRLLLNKQQNIFQKNFFLNVIFFTVHNKLVAEAIFWTITFIVYKMFQNIIYYFLFLWPFMLQHKRTFTIFFFFSLIYYQVFSFIFKQTFYVIKKDNYFVTVIYMCQCCDRSLFLFFVYFMQYFCVFKSECTCALFLFF